MRNIFKVKVKKQNKQKKQVNSICHNWSYQKVKLWQWGTFSQVSWKKEKAVKWTSNTANTWHMLFTIEAKSGPIESPFMPFHYWDSNQIELTVQWRAGSDFWEMNATFGANSERLLSKKSLYHHPDTASQFTLQRDELQTSLVTRQHWHIPGLHLSQEHRLLIRLVVFTNVKKTRKAVLLYLFAPCTTLTFI